MSITALEVKCPVCGRVNTPSEMRIDQDWQTKVFARYECRNNIKRLFRRDKPCETRYSVEWSGDKAARVIERMKEG